MSERKRDKKSKHSTRSGRDYSSGDGADSLHMHGSRGSRDRDTLNVPRGPASQHGSPPPRRDSDRMFPYTKDTGYSSAEISTISMSSAAYPYDPSSVASASTVGRDRDYSPPRPATRRGGRLETAQFSFASSRSSSRFADEELDESTASYGPSITYTNVSGRTSVLPSDFTETTFQGLPSDSDGEDDHRPPTRSKESTRDKGKGRRHSPETSDRSPCSPSERMPPQTSPPRSFADRHTDRFDPVEEDALRRRVMRERYEGTRESTGPMRSTRIPDEHTSPASVWWQGERVDKERRRH